MASISNNSLQQPKISLNDQLSQAAIKGNDGELKRLLDNGVDVNSKGIYGKTALHLAIEHGQGMCFQILLDRGADLDIRDKMGFTPLHTAVVNFRDLFVEILLIKRANPETQDKDGCTPAKNIEDFTKQNCRGCLPSTVETAKKITLMLAKKRLSPTSELFKRPGI